MPAVSVFRDILTSSEHSEEFFTDTLPVYMPFEVVIHNKPSDCWVIINKYIFDITPLIKKYKDTNLVKPLIAFAGKDISHWFDENSDVKLCIHPKSGVQVPFLPHGYIPDVPKNLGTSMVHTAVNECQTPWWKTNEYLKGRITERVRPVRVLNVLLRKEVQINVCCEDTLNEIEKRYSKYNSETHDNYVWVRADNELLDMTKTLAENGIPDERDRFEAAGLPSNYYIPFVKIMFKGFHLNKEISWK